MTILLSFPPNTLYGSRLLSEILSAQAELVECKLPEGPAVMPGPYESGALGLGGFWEFQGLLGGMESAAF